MAVRCVWEYCQSSSTGRTLTIIHLAYVCLHRWQSLNTTVLFCWVLQCWAHDTKRRRCSILAPSELTRCRSCEYHLSQTSNTLTLARYDSLRRSYDCFNRFVIYSYIYRSNPTCITNNKSQKKADTIMISNKKISEETVKRYDERH